MLYGLEILTIYVYIISKMCKISPNMTNDMANQPVKNNQDLKPTKTSDTAQESKEESTSELGVCIVL